MTDDPSELFRITSCPECRHVLEPADWRAMACSRCRSALGQPAAKRDLYFVLGGGLIAAIVIGIVLALAWIAIDSLRTLLPLH